MKVVVAPNAYKGTLSAPLAAQAMARGVREVFPDAEIVEVPVADGGDGTVDAIVSARQGEYRSMSVRGPLGDPVDAVFGLVDGGRAAVVELARASGLTLVAPGRRDPLRATTFGFGEVLRTVLALGVKAVIAGIGGSATNDGGAGMAQALGWRLLDAGGRELDPGGAALARLDRIDASGVDAGWRAVRIKVACDVTNPLLGPRGASAIYGPQKGANPDAVRVLDGALARFAAIVERDLGKRVADLPGAGAAGGAGAGLVAFLDAELVPGAPLVVDAAGLDEKLAGANLVLTGEGRADEQTGFGKAPGEVLRRARAAGVPVVVLAGSKGPGWEGLLRAGASLVVTLDSLATDRSEAMREPERMLSRAAVVACRSQAWSS